MDIRGFAILVEAMAFAVSLSCVHQANKHWPDARNSVVRVEK
jgi:hypothetical protein